MALDPSAKRINIKRSLKKYFVDNIELAQSITVTFDKSLSAPKVQGTTITNWVAIRIGSMAKGSESELQVDLYCCSRRDPEGKVLSEVVDKVTQYLSDTTKTDTMARIPFYDTSALPWTSIGSFVITDVIDSEEMEAPDETKFVVLSCLLKWSAKV